MRKLFMAFLLFSLSMYLIGFNSFDNNIDPNLKFEFLGYINDNNCTKINIRLKNESNDEFIDPDISLILSDKYEKQYSYTIKSKDINNITPNSYVDLEFVFENKFNLEKYNLKDGNVIFKSFIKDKSPSNSINMLFSIN
ncbi:MULTISPECIES: hypothetical protein [Romboutsia]|uniref:Prokaryotic membrane lipoprotein lipid attachment site profile n=1 Tax=Romboutsia hominis TaxID=1507512 RepID=A0A2P2BQ41_9FIRM|nr:MULTISPECIES: hypothetical protein [Romboutsia]MCH1959761.1 hypothetical protein [Romboutsia hominis]MCH1969815.1 hypothetical protein [Romboutsia hominis]MDB8803745.1 hypothetical protein [Romboutsia sp. 1001216sp1]MDB8806905.1 hypothetical protein [Romboutsia sp. 1001216sp1]MDB8809392.1 hypothetical protein [Romboutsia sp. 1001216sp1]